MVSSFLAKAVLYSACLSLSSWMRCAIVSSFIAKAALLALLMWLWLCAILPRRVCSCVCDRFLTGSPRAKTERFSFLASVNDAYVCECSTLERRGMPKVDVLQPSRIVCERTVRYPMPNKPTCVPQGHHTTSLQFTFNIQLRIPSPFPHQGRSSDCRAIIASALSDSPRESLHSSRSSRVARPRSMLSH